MNRRSVIVRALLLASLGVAGCSANDPNRQAKTGAVLGALAGAVIGHQIDHDSGRFVGAAVGGLVGAGIGHSMDEQQRAMELALAEERAVHALEIQRMQDDSLRITLDAEVSFESGSALILPSFWVSLNKVATVLNRYDGTDIRIVGHTDNVGGGVDNQLLSERRAEEVASYLALRGLSWSRMTTEGRGFREPRARNDSPAGRQRNRRVEIFVMPRS
jgi:outer membrane protein OmpA-like peptidoglycan-associated protein